MQLSRKAIDEFKQIYKDEYGIDLSDKEAMEKATRFLFLFKSIYKRILYKKNVNHDNI